MSSHLGTALRIQLKNNEMSQSAMSNAIRIKQPSLNAIINDGNRPLPRTLAAIVAFRFEKDPTAGVSLLIEHLRDEIDRAELTRSHPKAKIVVRAENESNFSDFEDSVARLSRHNHNRPELITLMNQLADLLDAQAGYPQSLAAEDRPEYGKSN